MKMSSSQAHDVAQQIYEAMREPLVNIVTELLAVPDEDELGPELQARVERAVAAGGA
jgi:hypothetical protein